jgi:hypothetical protein
VIDAVVGMVGGRGLVVWCLEKVRLDGWSVAWQNSAVGEELEARLTEVLEAQSAYQI